MHIYQHRFNNAKCRIKTSFPGKVEIFWKFMLIYTKNTALDTVTSICLCTW